MTTRVAIDEAALHAMAHHVLVAERFRLVLFAIPKVGCTELIQLMRRMAGASDWREDPHYTDDRPFLKDLGLARVDAILNDPSWTRAVVLRDPAERLLSAYLDKFIHSDSYAADSFRPSGRDMPFAEFLRHVLSPNRDPGHPTGLHPGTDPHWKPQRLVGAIERCESVLDLVGDFAEIGEWIEGVLRRVGAWQDFGATGWGSDGTRALFETNGARHVTHAARRMAEFYDRDTLRAVYDAYAGDIALAQRAGIELRKHEVKRRRGDRRVAENPWRDKRSMIAPVEPVFIHVSKNAGNSVLDTARSHIVSAGHRTAASWVAEHGHTAPLFAVIRNPFDRVVSEYSYRKHRYDSGDRNAHLANLDGSFEDWTLSIFRDGEFRTRAFFEKTGVPFNEGNMVGDSLLWFLPQLLWLGDEQGRLLVRDVLRFENLEGDWTAFARKYGIPGALRRRNASPREPGYRNYYSDETRDLIARYYQQDFEAFGYAF